MIAASAKAPEVEGARKLLSGVHKHLGAMHDLGDWNGSVARFFPKGMAGIGGAADVLASVRLVRKELATDGDVPNAKKLDARLAAAEKKLASLLETAGGALKAARSGLGDELNYVRVDKHTLQSVSHKNVFAIGDAADTPTSKAGAVAHFETDVVVGNLLECLHGQPMTHWFDGHANCFVESGDGKALLLDFDYETEPLPGRYPFTHLGPLSLLKETRTNHWGKLAFRWIYWHVLMPGRPLPLPARPALRGQADTTRTGA